MSGRPPIAWSAVVAQLRALGLSAAPVVVVHSSFRAVGPVEGGPLGLIAALRAALAPDATLVLPSMSDDDERPFDTASTPCSALGVVADTFWRQPGVVRSDNPASFAAVDPLASVITAPHPIAPPHGIDSPVGRARLARATDVVRVAVEARRGDPFAFLHPRGAGCGECDAAWESVPAS